MRVVTDFVRQGGIFQSLACVGAGPSPSCAWCQRSVGRGMAQSRSSRSNPWAHGSTSSQGPAGSRCTGGARSSSLHNYCQSVWGGRVLFLLLCAPVDLLTCTPSLRPRINTAGTFPLFTLFRLLDGTGWRCRRPGIPPLGVPGFLEPAQVPPAARRPPTQGLTPPLPPPCCTRAPWGAPGQISTGSAACTHSGAKPGRDADSRSEPTRTACRLVRARGGGLPEAVVGVQRPLSSAGGCVGVEAMRGEHHEDQVGPLARLFLVPQPVQIQPQAIGVPLQA